jgi:uncharacterized protein (TIGR02996 family)
MARPPPVFVTDTPAPRGASNPDLEAQLRDAPDDDALAQVYADWLIERGDPRGELAMAQLRGDAAREREILDANGGWLAGVSPEVAKIEWRSGRFRKIRVMNYEDWMSADFDTALVAERLLSQPAANCLEELAVGVLRWEYMAQDLHTLLADAAGRPLAPGLRALRLGDCDDIDIDNAHHEIGDLPDLSVFERLEVLTVWGYEIGVPDGLVLPHLRHLALQTCALDTETLGSVLAADVPALRQLELWFGAEDYGGNCGVDDLAPLLDARVHPQVDDLGLKNAEFTNELAKALLGSRILPRLRRLDLSMGTLDDAGADALLAAPDRWRHLETLDLTESFVSEGRLAALAEIGPKVVGAGDQKDTDDDDGFRYVSVAE